MYLPTGSQEMALELTMVSGAKFYLFGRVQGDVYERPEDVYRMAITKRLTGLNMLPVREQAEHGPVTKKANSYLVESFSSVVVPLPAIVTEAVKTLKDASTDVESKDDARRTLLRFYDDTL